MNDHLSSEICSSLTIGGLESNSLTIQEKDFIKTHQPSGVTLFARNIEKPNEIKKLEPIKDLTKCLSSKNPPFIVAIDQEGGTVARLKHPSADPGPCLTLADGKTDKASLEKLKSYGMEMGRSLLRSGFNVDFAPSVDTTSSNKPSECAINTRAFGFSTEEVIPRAQAFLQGLQQSGIYGCIKHFPGLGGVSIDTHKHTAIAHHSKEELQSKHMLPFTKLHSQAQMVMVSHCIYPKICPYEASRSHTIMTKILREKLKFQGLVVSDDLGMNAVSSANISWEEYIIQSISAGCDLLLICEGLEQWKIACHVIELEAKKNPSFKKRVLESYERIQKFRKKLPSC